MDISKRKLMRIIREETAAVVAEKRIKQTKPSNPHHKGRTGKTAGQFSSYDNSKSWSLHGKKHRMKSGKPAAPCGRGERRRCADGSYKYEESQQPEEYTTDEFRADHPLHGNEDELWALTVGILDELKTIDEADQGQQSDRKTCYTGNQINQLRERIFQQLLGFINRYEEAKRANKKTAA